MCVCGGGVIQVCECLWVCRRACWSRVSFSVALHFTALRQGLTVNGKFIVSARLAGHSSQDMYVSALKCWGHRAWASMTAFYVDAGDSSSGPLACTASVLTCQAIQLSYCYQKSWQHQEAPGSDCPVPPDFIKAHLRWECLHNSVPLGSGTTVYGE